MSDHSKYLDNLIKYIEERYSSTGKNGVARVYLYYEDIQTLKEIKDVLYTHKS